MGPCSTRMRAGNSGCAACNLIAPERLDGKSRAQAAHDQFGTRPCDEGIIRAAAETSGCAEREVGCRWVDCPREYGPHKTIYYRFARWTEGGIRHKSFEAVASPSEPPKQAALVSHHVKAHRRASGGKGGPKFRRSGARRAAAIAKST